MRETGEVETHRAAPLRVVAVLAGEVTVSQLWALKALAASAHDVQVVHATAQPGARATQLGGLTELIAARELRRQDAELERLFDGPPLRDWFGRSGIGATEVASLADDATRATIARLAPEVLVSLVGLEPVRHLAALARHATLGVALGDAAACAERQTIVRGIVEGYAEWVGANIHAIEHGRAASHLAWRARPQLAPGDSGAEVVFRAQVEAVQGLLELLDAYARGMQPASPECDAERAAAPRLWTWLRYVASGRGRAANSTCERALR
jgi:hypothetical protein